MYQGTGSKLPRRMDQTNQGRSRLALTRGGGPPCASPGLVHAAGFRMDQAWTTPGPATVATMDEESLAAWGPGESRRNEAGEAGKRIRHVRWDGGLFPNAVDGRADGAQFRRVGGSAGVTADPKVGRPGSEPTGIRGEPAGSKTRVCRKETRALQG